MGAILTLVDVEAWDIVSAARNKLIEDHKYATICVVDRSGSPILICCMDNVRPMTFDIALAKARQAAKTGKRTSDLREAVEKGETNLGPLGISQQDFVPWSGGVPVYDKLGNLLGGAAISNLTQEEDEERIIVAVREVAFFSKKPE